MIYCTSCGRMNCYKIYFKELCLKENLYKLFENIIISNYLYSQSILVCKNNILKPNMSIYFFMRSNFSYKCCCLQKCKKAHLLTSETQDNRTTSSVQIAYSRVYRMYDHGLEGVGDILV